MIIRRRQIILFQFLYYVCDKRETYTTSAGRRRRPNFRPRRLFAFTLNSHRHRRRHHRQYNNKKLLLSFFSLILLSRFARSNE